MNLKKAVTALALAGATLAPVAVATTVMAPTASAGICIHDPNYPSTGFSLPSGHNYMRSDPYITTDHYGQYSADRENIKRIQRKVGLSGSSVDGSFGPTTQSRVYAYQDRYNLDYDGKVGPQTWAHMVSTNCGG